MKLSLASSLFLSLRLLFLPSFLAVAASDAQKGTLLRGIDSTPFEASSTDTKNIETRFDSSYFDSLGACGNYESGCDIEAIESCNLRVRACHDDIKIESIWGGRMTIDGDSGNIKTLEVIQDVFSSDIIVKEGSSVEHFVFDEQVSRSHVRIPQDNATVYFKYLLNAEIVAPNLPDERIGFKSIYNSGCLVDKDGGVEFNEKGTIYGK
eukprot:4044437-Ditylum_brightwellii.AAC.1